MPYTLGDVEALKEELAAMPEADRKGRPLTKHEAVRVLSQELLKMLSRKGYSTPQLAALLTAKGIAITPPTLRSYLRQIKPAAPARQPRASARTPAARKPRSSGAAAETAPTAVAVGRGESADKAGTANGTAATPAKATFRPREDSDEI